MKNSAAAALVATDADVRRRVLDPARSFIVQAPAGSGKTELLMQRFLTVLAEVGEPQGVLAITFTRKAASEMRSRILEALEAAQLPAPEKLPPHQQQTRELALKVLARDRELGWFLLQNPSRLQVRTVDSFCDSLVRQLPFRAGFGAAAEVDPDSTSLYEEAALRTVLMLGDPDERLAGAIAQLLSYLDNDLHKAQDLVVGMLARRDQWLRHIGRADTLGERELASVRAQLEAALADAVRYELRIVRQEVESAIPQELRSELFALMSYAGSNIDPPILISLLRGSSDFPGDSPEDLDQWKAVHKFFFDSNGNVRGKLDKRHGFPTSNRAAKDRCQGLFDLLAEDERFSTIVGARFDRLYVLPPVRYTEEQWKFIQALFCVLPRAVANLKTIFAEEGRVDFAEVAQAAARALGTPEDPTDLSLWLGGRIQHILVDEFQDTSVVQVELLRALIATWEQGNGGSIFVVGDPMQSIYGFREAEVVLFQRTREQGIGEWQLNAAELRVNFRSQARLIDWFNQSFCHILTEDNQVTGAVAYAEADPILPPGPDPVGIHAFGSNDYVAEADRVADLVEQALREDERGSVAILVRSRSHLTEIVPALRARSIGFRAVKIDQLSARQAVLDVDALTHALLHLEDRASWIAVLRAPWCGLELADLWILCRDDRTSSVWELLQLRRTELSSAGQSRLNRILPVLAEALARRGRVPLRTWVESTWISLGGPAAVRADEDGVADLHDAAAFFDLLQQADTAGELPDPPMFRRQLEQLFAPADTADGIRVEIMTIHNAKGLEFDTVIVPGLGRRPKRDDPRLLYWRERVLDGELQLLLAPIESVSAGKDGKVATVEDYLRQIDCDRTAEENKRLLYVAATRARRKLHLLGHIAEPGKPPAAQSLLNILYSVPEIAAAFQALPEEVPEPQPETTAPRLIPQLRRLPLDWQLPAAPQPLTLASAATHDAAELQLHTFDWVGETLRRVGTVAHAFLQQIGREGLEHWGEQQIQDRIPTIRAALLASGIPPIDLAAATAKVVRALTTALGDERGRWILGPRADARCEFELSGVIDGEVRRVKIDRTFIDADTRWVIDYKMTDREGGSREQFLEQQVEKYRADLELYRCLIGRLDHRPIRCALYFPLLREFRELS